MVCPPVTSEAGARRPRSISNFGGLCQTRKTPTLTPFVKIWSVFGNHGRDNTMSLIIIIKKSRVRHVEKNRDNSGSFLQHHSH
jgi:hypothetical protein